MSAACQRLLADVRACRVCEKFLPHGVRPVVQISPRTKILIVGQAPGRRVHESGVPWQDASGDNLRAWLGVETKKFYDPEIFALMPMGFCYPGTFWGDRPSIHALLEMVRNGNYAYATPKRLKEAAAK